MEMNSSRLDSIQNNYVLFTMMAIQTVTITMENSAIQPFHDVKELVISLRGLGFGRVGLPSGFKNKKRAVLYSVLQPKFSL
jgi:hypothetical protein